MVKRLIVLGIVIAGIAVLLRVYVKQAEKYFRLYPQVM